MFYIKLLLFLLAHTMLLPIKWALGILFSVLFNPTFSFNKYIFRKDPTKLEDKLDKCHQVLDLNVISNCGDGVKFLGMAYGSSQINIFWNELKKFWYNSTFIRIPNIEQMQLENNFSGDMFAGMGYAITQRFLADQLTQNEITHLINIFDETIFKNFFSFTHPFDDNPDRGFLLPLISISVEFFNTLATIGLAYQITKQKKYKFLYYILKGYCWLVSPIVDYSIWVNNWTLVKWYSTHSNMIYMVFGYLVTKDKFFKDVATKIYNRFKFNPEIAALYNKYISDSWDKSISNTIYIYLEDYDPENIVIDITIPDEFIIETKDLEDFVKRNSYKKIRSKYILPTRFRSGNYSWEENLIKPSIGYNSGRTLDFISLYYLNKK